MATDLICPHWRHQFIDAIYYNTNLLCVGSENLYGDPDLGVNVFQLCRNNLLFIVFFLYWKHILSIFFLSDLE